MTPERPVNAAVAHLPHRLVALSGGFWRERRLREILRAAGISLRFGLPRPGDAVLVWGRRPPSRRGRRLAVRRGLPLVTAEDPFLRSIHPAAIGREPPPGLLLDDLGVHYDPRSPSRIERILATHPFDVPLLARARAAIARLRRADLSKYNAHDPAAPLPEPGFVLVVDQLAGDASVTHGGIGREAFARMLEAALDENPGRPVLLKLHPETAAGGRPGHFDLDALPDRVIVLREPVSPWRLLERAGKVYAVSSQLGFEAILAGHRPVLFGAPFHAGWHLSDDRGPVPDRRGRALSPEALFAAAMILAPLWHDPVRGEICPLERVIDQLEARVGAFRQDRTGYVAHGMRLWKRRFIAAIFTPPAGRPPRFIDDPRRAVRAAAREGRPLLVWARAATPALEEAARLADVPLRRVEDGFLRSTGLGAALVPPLSLVLDDRGIYYDPARPSRLETLIAAAPDLPETALARAERLRRAIVDLGLSKYNLGAPVTLPKETGRPVILVPGQVEDDAAILRGAGEVRTNRELLEAVRAARPGAFIVYKPHPDVEAGLRAGRIAPDALRRLADLVVTGADPARLLAQVDEVWTITSLTGFEALLHGRPVVTLGAPFYAGWGLTRDLGPVPTRRRRPVPLAGLVHAALIDYPRYFDPLTGSVVAVEDVLWRLARGEGWPTRPGHRFIARLQGAFASWAWLWR